MYRIITTEKLDSPSWPFSCNDYGVLSNDKRDPLLLAAAVAVSRFGFRSHLLYDIDSVNFGLALERFDPRVHQPHPPGYFLYVWLGRLLNGIFHDANLSLVVLSIAASCGTVVLIYLLTQNWFGTRPAQFAGLLFLFSPLAWFHGTVALTYSVEAFFSALLGFICWRIYGGSAKLILPGAIVLGVSAGVRPSSLLFLGPLFLFSLRKAVAKQMLLGLGALGLTLATWFLAMILTSGGFSAYFGALLSLWQSVAAKNTVFNSSPATSIARACTIVFIYLLCFGAASIAPLWAMHETLRFDSKQKIFTIVWITPALCFFVFVFLKFVNSGYLLILAVPACIWLGACAAGWYEKAAYGWRIKLTVIALCAIANVLIFLASPLYCSYRSVRGFEAYLTSVQTTLPQLFPARDTLIVGLDSHFSGYRHAGYYLPDYLTLEYPEVRLREGVRIFAMHNRDTQLLEGLPITSGSRFVLFPLPGGDPAFRKSLETVKEKLPSQGLLTTSRGGVDFVSGPVSDLPLLFPEAAANAGVYVSLH